MILYLLWETHFGFSRGTVDSRGIYKFKFIGFGIMRNHVERLIIPVTVAPFIDMPQISQ